tara:strand:- start:155 stop:613 length:459 start_codon:yes stop_codon:yes gene_type:complete
MLGAQQRALAAAGLSLVELKALLRAEEEARLSEETQATYGQVESEGGDKDWLCVTEELQRRVVLDAGVPTDRLAAAVHLMQQASSLFPDDADLHGPRAISLYVRHQRAERGSIRPGDVAPDLPLYHLDGTTTTVHDVCKGATRTLFVSGSFT